MNVCRANTFQLRKCTLHYACIKTYYFGRNILQRAHPFHQTLLHYKIVRSGRWNISRQEKALKLMKSYNVLKGFYPEQQKFNAIAIMKSFENETTLRIKVKIIIARKVRYKRYTTSHNSMLQSGTNFPVDLVYIT